MSRPIGFEPESWGYHGDDGQCVAQHIGSKHFGQPYNPGDIIGCGVNFRDRTAFFTKNGARTRLSSGLEIMSLLTNCATADKQDAFTNITKSKLYPAISMKRSGEHVRANFGQTPFVYDINQFMKVSFATGVLGLRTVH